MTILEAINKGKSLRTKSGFRAQFVAMLPANIPARILMEVNGKGLENYYLDGKHISPIESHMDLIIDEL